ncbi:MAG: VCBS repeat-containing protein [Proteobacteria bacterium]|jgi:hypothetical protein|nr:VCBS repeat-containing protein [Pseudomonadota bacterium]
MLIGSVAMLGLAIGCGGSETPTPTPDVVEPAPEPQPPAEPGPTLIVVQAHFKKEGGKPTPQPAKMTLLRQDGDKWWDSEVLDKDSNVFHKAIPWRDGILTIGAQKALLRHFKKVDGKWQPAATLWERSWGGKFNRLRDIEIGDVNGDGAENIVLATHDQGVVAVGSEIDGKWVFTEMDQAADTFVHEIEIGDLDGDGKKEFYCTPSGRNLSSGVSQAGGVARYSWDGKQFVRSMIVEWEESHAKEITVVDLDGNGEEELYVVREAHTKKEGKKTVIVDPVKIIQVAKDGDSFKETVVAELDDKQCRFLVPGDVNGDGKTDLVAAGMESGLWALEQQDDKTLKKVLIDAKSGGFEHATHVTDLDGDKKMEIYVAADKQQAIRQYIWDGSSYSRKKIFDIPDRHITWNIQDGVF